MDFFSNLHTNINSVNIANVHESLNSTGQKYEFTNIDDFVLINAINPIFEAFKQKNKKHFHNWKKILISIIDCVNEWSTPYIVEILCELIQKSIRFEKEYAYIILEHLIKK